MNKYAIAVDYQTFLANNLHKMQSKPEIKKKHDNIFQPEGELENIKPQQLKDKKSYELVGLKQLKAYEKKIKKYRRNTKQETIVSYASRASSRGANSPKQIYLNKDEVYQSMQKHTNQHCQSHHQSQTDSLYENSSQSQPTQTLPPTKRLKLRPTPKNTIHQFSLAAIKEKHEEYRKGWQEKQKEQKQKVHLPCLYERVQKYRSVVQSLHKSSLEFQLKQRQRTLWVSTLREQNNKRMEEKLLNFPHFVKDLKLGGIDKLEKEKKWLESQELDGFQFQLCPSQSYRS